jgi:sirohydrochlorin cobaltochelatase
VNLALETDGIVLVGHGTRNETGQKQFLRLAEHLRAAVPVPLETAYIELQSPSIEETLVRMHDRGPKKIILSPALLFAAGHAKRDIPAAVAAARSCCPDLQVKIAEPLGCHQAVLELAAQRAHAATRPGQQGNEGQLPPIDSSTTLVLIGRGSSDPEAVAHCRHFAAELASRLKINRFLTGFIAIAEPSLPAVLEQAAADRPRQVIVQPHLLFTGEMLESTSAAVQAAQRAYPHILWRQADVLGSDLLGEDSQAALLVRALRDRLF